MKPADRVVLQDEARAVALVLMGLGVSTVVAGLAWAPDRTWPNLLLSNLYLLTLALAGALVICIQFLSGAGWAVVLRRVAEAMMSCLPVVAVMMMTVFFGRQALYPWANPDAHEALAAGKAEYLSTPFVFTRMVLVLALWVLLARAIRKTSLLQDRDQDLRHHHRLVRLSAMFAVVVALTFALASVDWVMSLDPHWYSTIFAVYLFAGLLLSGFAAVTLIVVLLRALGYLRDVVGDSHLHDLGKLLFAFSTFWAYIWFSQYLLIWYTNLPEEVTYYARRTSAAWAPLFVLNLVVNWVVPFVVLLPRAAKRNPRVLVGVSVLLLGGHWLDLYLLVMPELVDRPAVGLLEIFIPLSYSALFFFLTSRALAQAPLVPLNDPYLQESLSHHT